MRHNPIAIIYDKQSISFAELTNFITGTANYFLNNGIKQKDYVSLLSNNSLEYVISIFALWRINAIPVPINVRLTENEISAIHKSVNSTKIIKSVEFQKYCIYLPSIEMEIESNKIAINYHNKTNPNDTAVIIHTSGSSGKPKGVEVTNNNLYQSYLSEAQEFGFSHKDRFLLSLPFYHIGGFAILNRALLSGGILILPKSLKQNDVIMAMKKEDPTIISLVPTVLNRFLENGIQPNNRLRILFLGGGPSNNDLIRSALKKKYPIVKVYGSSETTAMVTACWGSDLEKKPASAGKIFENVELKILDESKNIVNKNIVGEIAIKSETIVKGYLNDKSNWESKIYKGYYLTGDYGFLDNDNYLFVVSRRTDLIISGGENIDPREVEMLINEHPNIQESFVFPIEDVEWGQIPASLIVLKKQTQQKKDTIIKELKIKIASFKMPKKILFVADIPKSELGKINIEEVNRLLKKNINSDSY